MAGCSFIHAWVANIGASSYDGLNSAVVLWKKDEGVKIVVARELARAGSTRDLLLTLDLSLAQASDLPRHLCEKATHFGVFCS